MNIDTFTYKSLKYVCSITKKLELLLWLLFFKAIFFRGVLNSQQNGKESTEIFHILRLHISTAYPIINIPNQGGTFVTIKELTLMHHYHPKFIVYIRSHSRWWTFYRFWQMTFWVAQTVKNPPAMQETWET